MALAVLLAVVAPAAAAPLLSPATGAARRRIASLPGVGGVQKLALDRRVLADLRGRDQAAIEAFPLGATRTADLVVTRFEPFAPGARVEVMEADGPHALALPDAVYFRGTVAGDDASHVLLVAAPDRVHGFVVAAGEVYPFGPDAAGGHRSYSLRNADPTIHPPPGDFCANDLHPEAVAIPAAPPVLADPVVADTSLKQADVAIETDQELRAKFPSDQAALDYLASLAAAATAIYERDVSVHLRFSYIRLWNTTDPWTATDTGGSLTEFRNYWNTAANNMATIAGPRTVAHFVSGKSVQGGIGYVNVLCNASFGYAVSQVFGSFDLAQPSQIWDVEVFTHELGHNFGSPHSHCYVPPVDKCYNQEPGCYAGAVVASRGTIMSYCHLLAGGLANIDLLFGSVVSAQIGQSVAAASCLGTVSTSTTTTSTSTSTSSTSASTTSTSTTSTSTTSHTTSTSSSTSTSHTTSSSTTTSTSTSLPAVTTSTTAATSTTTSTSTSRTTSSSTTTSTSTTSSSSTTAHPTTTTTSSTRPATTTTTAPIRDTDGDGVLDNVDACPGTPPGDLVDATGCSVCPCDGPRAGGSWRSHTAYLRCVRGELRRRSALGFHEPRQAGDGARQASCGRPATTRCCVYAGPRDVTGRCRILRATDCESRSTTGDAVDLGRGSCMPSPCRR